jgi:uncharacterized damage-inducible protein DinB
MNATSLVGPGFVRMMAAYNAEMNVRLYEAAGRLSDGERRRERGAFWGSILGTFSHLMWADQLWMSRFDGWATPAINQKQSAGMFPDFATLHSARVEADAKIIAWAGRVDEAWLGCDQTWFSGSVGREVTLPRGVLMAHFFNHQTHHRGQAHALITASGEKTGDTDLAFIPQAFMAAMEG